jgi:hypothetical protein
MPDHIAKKILFVAVIICCQSQLYAQTKAHELSRYAVIDPSYNMLKNNPVAVNKAGAPWLYGYSELESWRLQVMQNENKDAALKVGYPGDYHLAYKNVSFRLQNKHNIKINSLTFYATGDVKVIVNDHIVIYDSKAKKSAHIVDLTGGISVKKLQIDLSTTGEPGCLLIEGGPFSTSNKAWAWQAGKEEWQPPFQYSQLSNGRLPHEGTLQEIHLNAVSQANQVSDFGRELLGYVYIKSTAKPIIGVGESVAEARDTSKQNLEQTAEMIDVGAGSWRSEVPLAFRYVKLFTPGSAAVSCGALFYSAQYKGAFSCSDSLLTKIWMNSAYTLRLCMGDFLIDGVKRDRLPWAGDLAMSMQANAFSFADREPVRRSLLVLGRAGIKQKDINGIIDYSLWWIISQDMYQQYYGDMPHLKREWPRIKEALNVLNSRCDSLGLLKSKDTWLFIDWVEANKNTALQILWWWAQNSAAKLASRMGDTQTMQMYNKKSALLKDQLLKLAWNKQKGAWMDDPYHPQKISRHANIFAVISNMADRSQYKQIATVLKGSEADKVGTPYMAGFENMALSRLGNEVQSLNNVKTYWGGMLNNGATTFWEAYDASQTGNEKLAFYDRPYGKSLCHAWSSGPAAFLPSEILGVKPLADGWKVFSIAPQTGFLRQINATVPTPHGNILFEIIANKMQVQIPAGTSAQWKGKLYPGPMVLKGNVE